MVYIATMDVSFDQSRYWLTCLPIHLDSIWRHCPSDSMYLQFADSVFSKITNACMYIWMYLSNYTIPYYTDTEEHSGKMSMLKEIINLTCSSGQWREGVRHAHIHSHTNLQASVFLCSAGISTPWRTWRGYAWFCKRTPPTDPLTRCSSAWLSLARYGVACPLSSTASSFLL